MSGRRVIFIGQALMNGEPIELIRAEYDVTEAEHTGGPAAMAKAAAAPAWVREWSRPFTIDQGQPDTPEPPPPLSTGASMARTTIIGIPLVALFWIVCAWLKSRGVSFP